MDAVRQLRTKRKGWTFENIPYERFEGIVENLNPHLISGLTLVDIEVGEDEQARLIGGRGFASRELQNLINRRPLPHLDGTFMSLVLDAVCAIVWAQDGPAVFGSNVRYGVGVRMVSLGGTEAWLREAVFRDGAMQLSHMGIEHGRMMVCDGVRAYWEIQPDQPHGRHNDWRTVPSGHYRLGIEGEQWSKPYGIEALYVREGMYRLIGDRV